MNRMLAVLIIPIIGCSTNFDAKPIVRSGSTPVLNKASIVKTYENLGTSFSFPLGINLPIDFKSYKYLTLIASKSKNTGGWEFIPNVVDFKIDYCLRGPAPLAPVTMALSTPYLIVGHNEIVEVREVFNCK
jgi:hypothetical protein